ncbi:MAG TPA: MG2 domain-containing protein, partial [Pyrinomonadaceae bacterium]|nr:MG2 domain-containing protein [Pyrinomonadaceae bacterium]
MKTIILSVVVFAFLLFQATAQQPDYQQQKATAEAEYGQKSYARAHDIYASVDKSKLNAADVRWVEFRLADTSWRAQAATQTSDTTKYEEAQKQLDELIRVADKDVDRDLVWAEAHESLGDMSWTRQNQRNWGGAWPHYQQALDWWAGQRDLERARLRYLAIVFKAAAPSLTDDAYLYGYYGNHIPVVVLENALKISTTANERSLLNYLLATTAQSNGGPRDAEASMRIAEYFEEALKAGKQSDWYDDALYRYAEWLNNYGTAREVGDGYWQLQPDYVKALAMYRRLTTEFSAGETRFYEGATRQIINITTPNVAVTVSNVFLPDSEIQFGLSSRNVRRVDLALYKVDLTRDIPNAGADSETDAGQGEIGSTSWTTNWRANGRVPFKTWTREVKDEDYRPFSEQARIDGRLPVGAYVLEAKITGGVSRELILVSDATLVLKSSGKQALAFFSNAVTGAPIANANVTLWESYYEMGGTQRWRRMRQTTNSDGVAQFSFSGVIGSRNLFATAAGNDRQAFSGGRSYRVPLSQEWRIYAFTDRPAYRPKETLQWKFIARQYSSGEYSTPANQVITYQINDPRGTKMTEGKVTLNAFGSAWGSFDLGEQLPLGQYYIYFWNQNKSSQIGSASLFRLEEYKLPEYEVSVTLPEDPARPGSKRLFRLGDRVEAVVQADYYFGGPV